ncbi:MAG: DNA-processing protein DprA [Eubacteriales bacterium]
MNSSVMYWLWLATRKGMTPQLGRELFHAYEDSIEKLYLAQKQSLSSFGLKPEIVKALENKSLDIPQKLLEDCNKYHQSIITYQDAIYPQKLKELINPPLLLYAKGNLPLIDETLSLCMVGAREASPYGVYEATEIALTLASAGVLLVTGMAQGIDTAVVQGALKSGKPLVSVVAGGMDKIYPKQNKFLYEDVASIGVLLSEYPPESEHHKTHFRPRNRILCGLSDGVMIVECLRRGGTMMTAQIAEEQQRDLFALPASIRSPLSEGPHQLIKNNQAQLVTCGEDILHFYQNRYPLLRQPLSKDKRLQRVKDANGHSTMTEKKKSPVQTPKEKEIRTVESENIIPVSKQKSLFTDDQITLLHTLGEEEMAMDILVEKSQIPAKRTLSAMTLLEMGGQVKEVSSGRFQSMVRLKKSQ